MQTPLQLVPVLVAVCDCLLYCQNGYCFMIAFARRITGKTFAFLVTPHFN